MGKLIVTGGNKLKGEIIIDGSKNAVLPILSATVLNEGINVIKNCPKLRDVELILKILETIGCKVSTEGNTLIIDSSSIKTTEIPEDLAVEMRSSIIFMGSLLAKHGKVTISHPGGWVIVLAQLNQ